MPVPQEKAPAPLQEREAQRVPFEIVVPFTTIELTQAALAEADTLIRQLDGRIRVILIHGVPQAFALNRPAVAQRHLENMVHSLVSSSSTSGEVYLARDVEQTWRRLLRRRLAVVIASRKRLWRTPQERLARMLERNGHEILLIYPETGAIRMPKASTA